MPRQDATARSTEIELYHHFTIEAEFDGLEQLLDGFHSHQNVLTVAETADDNLRLNVTNRILKEDAPDLWDIWPGETLLPFDDAGALLDITDVWSDNGFEQQYIDAAASAAQVDGRYVSLPMDVYRINNLFYNVELVEKAGVDPRAADSPRAFLDVLEAVNDELDVAGFLLPMRDAPGILQFWETLFLGEFGEAVYTDVTSGDARDHRAAIRESLALLEAFADLTTEDAFFLGLGDIGDVFVGDGAAFMQDGDWGAGALLGTDDFEFGEDWGHAPFPGTSGLYQMNMNAFVASANTTERDAIETFLAYAGSVEGLRLFNKAKGSLPPRTDVPMDDFSRFHRSQYDEFSDSVSHPPSIAHGLAVSPNQLIELKAAVAQYASDWDRDAATDQFVDILSADR